MQKVKLTFLSVMIFFFLTAHAPARAFNKVKWIAIEDVVTNLKIQKRPVLIDLYTDWCGWCKVMDKKTYSNENVAAYLGDKFYAVRLNAETKKEIIWDGK